MKKLFFIGLLAVSLCAFTANVSAPETPKTHNGQSVDRSPKWPYGAATNSTLTADVTYTLTVTNQLTLVNFGTLDTAMALTITPDAGLEAGALLIIKAKSDATARTITLTGALPATMSGTISKTKVQTFVYNGSSFIATGAIVQLD